MIQLKIVSPLPQMLQLSDRVSSWNRDVAFQEGMTAGSLMDLLANEFPEFGALWESKECAALQQCLFAVDGASVEAEDKWKIPLRDGMALKMFMPYAGG